MPHCLLTPVTGPPPDVNTAVSHVCYELATFEVEVVGEVFEIFAGVQDVHNYGRVPRGDRNMRYINEEIFLWGSLCRHFVFLGVMIKDNSQRSQKFPSSQCDSHQQKL